MTLPSVCRYTCGTLLRSAALLAGLLLASGGILPLRAAAPFTGGNLALLVASASVNNTTGSVVEINTTTAGQSAVQTVAVPGTGTDACRISGSATSTGYVSSSADRSLLTFNCVNTADTASNVNTLNPRAVFTVNNAGTIVKQTTYTGGSGNQTRSSTTLNNTTWYIADQGRRVAQPRPVETFQLSREQSPRAYPELGVAAAHHWVSHHGNSRPLMADKAKIDAYHVRLLTYYIDALKRTADGDGTLLDRVAVLYGAAMGDPNGHQPYDLPSIVVGRANGKLKTGRHLAFREEDEVPQANLLRSLLDLAGVEVDAFGDSTGRLNGLTGV